ncbi:unnamed protein product [Blepharisma stoltei]|uniref:Uncharacterized protein n=1 Tax=Blepharisma stoltei TaxID=1481888 RepID=A0AAU9J988_9CILI|nr:unnamed protein product [Blepharisma stoltei]
MKISQLLDSEVDQNEIESKYLWYLTQKSSNRINLSAFTIDLSWSSKNLYISPRMALPSNQIYGIGNYTLSDNFQSELIVDENSNIKTIQGPKRKDKYCNFFTSCYYDDSILTFECNFDKSSSTTIQLAKKYLISMNKWVCLCPLPSESPISCIGFNQKILIVVESYKKYGIYLYDIILDSYTYGIPVSDLEKKHLKTLVKSKGKIYLIILYSKFYEIYSTDDPLSEWDFVCCFQDCLVYLGLSARTFYEGSIYYIRENSYLYEFKLSNYKSKAVGDLREVYVNQQIQKL